MTVLFDLEPDPPEREPPPPWVAAAASRARAPLLADAVAERATAPCELVRAAATRSAARARRRRRGPRGRRGWRAMAAAGHRGRAAEPAQRAHRPAPALRVGRRRPRRSFKAIKDALGGTVNDVVLTVVTGALRAHLLRRGRDPEGLELKAMVPVSVRADAERGALGNRVAAMYAPLPVGIDGPGRALPRSSTPRWRASRSPARRSAPRRSPRLAGFARADRARPGRAAAVAPALLQPDRDQRARAAVPAVHARPPAARRSTRRCRWCSTRRSASRSCPTTGSSTSGCSATTTRCRTSTRSPPTCERRDRRAGRGAPPASTPPGARAARRPQPARA